MRPWKHAWKYDIMFLILFLILFLAAMLPSFAQVHSETTLENVAVPMTKQVPVRVVESSMQTLALRLSPGMDIKEELERIVKDHHINAASILTCVGSLREAVVRFANKPKGTALGGPLEIVSLTGTFGQDGSHLHIALTNGEGTIIGGHVLAGCRVYTTAEIVLGILTDAVFTREQDSTSGYKELVVRPVDKK